MFETNQHEESSDRGIDEQKIAEGTKSIETSEPVLNPRYYTGQTKRQLNSGTGVHKWSCPMEISSAESNPSANYDIDQSVTW